MTSTKRGRGPIKFATARGSESSTMNVQVGSVPVQRSLHPTNVDPGAATAW